MERVEPNVRDNIKALLLLQIADETFQSCPEFYCHRSSQNQVEDFWKCENLKFNNLFFFFVHGTQWEWRFQNDTPPTNRSQSFHTCPEFSFAWSSQKSVGDFVILLIFFFFFLCENFKFTIVPYGKTKKNSIIWKTSRRTPKRSHILGSQYVVVHICGALDVVAFKVIWG